MTKRLLYIVVLLILTSRLSVAKPVVADGRRGSKPVVFHLDAVYIYAEVADTTKNKKPDAEDKKKVKEIAKAKKLAKPEKLGELPTDTLNNKLKLKLKRQRRPEGLERPPEIPRRNN